MVFVPKGPKAHGRMLERGWSWMAIELTCFRRDCYGDVVSEPWRYW